MRNSFNRKNLILIDNIGKKNKAQIIIKSKKKDLEMILLKLREKQQEKSILD